jgi:hypothetical protein
MGDPDFLHAAPTRFAYAAFIKESGMKFANANKLDRKSGGSPTIASNSFAAPCAESNGKQSSSPRYAGANLGHPSSVSQAF